MFGSLRRLLVVGAVGVTMMVMMVLTAMPAAASAPRNNPCPSGNFTCYRANHVHVVQQYRVVRVAQPVYVAPRYVVPQYVAPQYVTSYAPTYMPGYNTVGFSPAPYYATNYGYHCRGY